MKKSMDIRRMTNKQQISMGLASVLPEISLPTNMCHAWRAAN